MRVPTLIAAASLFVSAPALAQNLEQPGLPSGGDTVAEVDVVDMEELPPDVRIEVNAALEQASTEDLQALRASIDATPAAASALKAKGDTSSDVVAVNIGDDGQLTLITLPEV